MGYIAFIKSIKNRLFAKGGFQYAKHFYKTAMENPKYIPELVNSLHVLTGEKKELLQEELSKSLKKNIKDLLA